jgi:hypothetical protein
MVVTVQIMVFLVGDTKIPQQYATSIFTCCETICCLPWFWVANFHVTVPVHKLATLSHTNFIPKDEGSMFLWNVGIYLQNYMVLKLRKT